MKIKLAYGRRGLDVELDDEWDVTVIEPRYEPGLVDPAASLREALRQPVAERPLREIARPSDRIGVVFSDITRAMPNRIVLPQILAELPHVPPRNIIFFCALGTHRSCTNAELRSLLGDEIVDQYRIVQNDAFDGATQAKLGVSHWGHEIWLNKELLGCDLKILTGFIEPHLFAGFSGGGKAIMPGMAGLETVLGNHDAVMLNDPRATWGVRAGNPVFEEIHEIAHLAGPSFLVNITLSSEKEITAVFAGQLDAAHEAGCDAVRAQAMVKLAMPQDIVITTNSGYPLDLNLYQTVKGMSAGARAVRDGGTIIVASECSEGLPAHGFFGELLGQAKSPRALLDRITAPGFLEQDQWQAQLLAMIGLRAEVFLRSDGLTDLQIREALLTPCHSIEETLDRLVQRIAARPAIAVLPQGPQVIPYY
jgi:lactate racemase